MNLANRADFEKCITPFNEKNFKRGSYNLSIAKIIDTAGNEHPSLNLVPQGIVYVIFNEHISLPENIIGFAHVKTSYTQRSILSTNIGIIDPSYKGNLSTLLINFGKVAFRLNKNDEALRITLNKLDDIEHICNSHESISDASDVEKYTKLRKADVNNLDDKFLNLSSLKNDIGHEVKREIFTSIRNYVGFLTMTALIVSLIVMMINLIKESNSSSYKQYAEHSVVEKLNKKIDSLNSVLSIIRSEVVNESNNKLNEKNISERQPDSTLLHK